MNEAQALALLATLLALPDASTTKTFILQYAQAAYPPVDTTSFELGDPTERFLEIASQAMQAWGVVPQQAVEALFFPLATDPGDVRDDGTPDPSPNQTPRPGMLSAVGQSFYGTTRGGQTYAESFVTIKNNGATATLPFGPGQLTLEYSTAPATAYRTDGGTPTYVNTADASIYTGIGGTLTLAPNATATIPVLAVQIGGYGAAPLGGIDMVVTQSFGNLVVVGGSSTATASGAQLERETRDLYIARCLLSADAHSPGGPQAAYLRAMRSAKDGTILQRYDGSGPVNIIGGYVSPSSTTGVVTIYYQGPAGAVDAIDRDSANANALGTPLGVITDPIGVMPGTATLAPFTYGSSAALPSGTPGGDTCANLPIAVTYSARIPASLVVGGASLGTYMSGGSPPAPIANIFTAIATTLGIFLPGLGVGGVEQVAGAGVVYTSDIQDAIPTAYKGVRSPNVTLPASSTSAVALGQCPIAGTITGTLTVVAG